MIKSLRMKYMVYVCGIACAVTVLWVVLRLSTGNRLHWVDYTAQDALPNVGRPGDLDLKELQQVSDQLNIPLQDLIDKEWDRRDVSYRFAQGRDDLVKLISSFPLRHHRVDLSETQISALHDTIAELLTLWGGSDRQEYVNYLRSRGERVEPRIEALILRQGRVQWDGIVSEGSEYRVFKTSFPELPLPGDELFEVRKGYTEYHRLTEPPRFLKEALDKDGEVIIADTQLFVLLSGDMAGKVRVYVIRHWYDRESKTWVRHQMTTYGNPSESFVDGIVF